MLGRGIASLATLVWGVIRHVRKVVRSEMWEEGSQFTGRKKREVQVGIVEKVDPKQNRAGKTEMPPSLVRYGSSGSGSGNNRVDVEGKRVMEISSKIERKRKKNPDCRNEGSSG